MKFEDALKKHVLVMDGAITESSYPIEEAASSGAENGAVR